MKKYNVSIPYFAAVLVTVEAENEKEAIQAAYEEADPGLCYQCSRHVEVFESDENAEVSVEEDGDVVAPGKAE